jgi:hypothetical protein
MIELKDGEAVLADYKTMELLKHPVLFKVLKINFGINLASYLGN